VAWVIFEDPDFSDQAKIEKSVEKLIEVAENDLMDFNQRIGQLDAKLNDVSVIYNDTLGFLSRSTLTISILLYFRPDFGKNFDLFDCKNDVESALKNDLSNGDAESVSENDLSDGDAEAALENDLSDGNEIKVQKLNDPVDAFVKQAVKYMGWLETKFDWGFARSLSIIWAVKVTERARTSTIFFSNADNLFAGSFSKHSLAGFDLLRTYRSPSGFAFLQSNLHKFAFDLHIQLGRCSLDNFNFPQYIPEADKIKEFYASEDEYIERLYECFHDNIGFSAMQLVRYDLKSANQGFSFSEYCKNHLQEFLKCLGLYNVDTKVSDLSKKNHHTKALSEKLDADETISVYHLLGCQLSELGILSIKRFSSVGLVHNYIKIYQSLYRYLKIMFSVDGYVPIRKRIVLEIYFRILLLLLKDGIQTDYERRVFLDLSVLYHLRNFSYAFIAVHMNSKMKKADNVFEISFDEWQNLDSSLLFKPHYEKWPQFEILVDAFPTSCENFVELFFSELQGLWPDRDMYTSDKLIFSQNNICCRNIAYFNPLSWIENLTILLFEGSMSDNPVIQLIQRLLHYWDRKTNHDTSTKFRQRLGSSSFVYFQKQRIVWLPDISDDIHFKGIAKFKAIEFTIPAAISKSLKKTLHDIFMDPGILNRLLLSSIDKEGISNQRTLIFLSATSFFKEKFQLVLTSMLFLKSFSESNLQAKVLKILAWGLNLFLDCEVNKKHRRLEDLEMINYLKMIRIYPFQTYLKNNDNQLRMDFQNDDESLSNVFSYLLLPRALHKSKLMEFSRILNHIIEALKLR